MERVVITGPFGGILGNGPALRLLESALEKGEVAHAYLFYGLPGVGKRSVAYRLGAELVSAGDEGARDRALRGLHPDLDEVEPEGQFTTIGQVREVVRGVARSEEHTSELQSRQYLVCRLLLEKKQCLIVT